MILKDDITGYLLPVRDERTTGLITPDGEMAVKKTKWIDFHSTFSGGGGAYTQPYLEIGETSPLVLYLDYEHTAVFNTDGKLITILPDRIGTIYNDHGIIVYENGKYGFMDHDENLVLDYIYDNITMGSSGYDYLKVEKDRKEGLVDSKNGKHIFDPEYSNIRPLRNIEGNLFKAEKDGDVYLYDKNGEMLLELDYEETWTYSSGLLAVRESGQWGFIDLSGEFVIEPAYDKVNVGFFNGFCMVKQDGKYGYVDKNNRPVTAIEYDNATAFENEAAAAIKDDRLIILDREGNNFVEPLEINPEDYTDNRPANLQLTYLEGPEAYRTLDFSYFDQDGWIRKHD